LLAGATGIGFAPILVRWSEVGPSATAFHRLLLALPWLWLWVGLERWRRPEAPQPSSAKGFLLLMGAGLFFAGDLAVWHWSLQFTSVANSTLLTNFAPLFVTLGAWLLLREEITGVVVVGMATALAGATLLVQGGLSFSTRRLWGDALALITAVLYAGYLLLVKRLRCSFSTATIMAWSGVVSCPALLLIAALSGERMLPATPNGWWVLAALAVVSHVGGQALIACGLGYLPASFSSVSLLWQPVVATAAAWVIFKERMDGWQGFGAGVVLLGIAIASRQRQVSLRPRR